MNLILQKLLLTLLFIGTFSVEPQPLLSQNGSFFSSQLSITLAFSKAAASSVLTSDEILALKKKISGLPSDSKDGIAMRLKLARHYKLAEEPQKVIDHLRPAVTSLDVSGLKILANAYSTKKEYLQVIRILENLTQEHKNDYVSYKRLGDAYSEIKNYDESMKNYAKAIKINKRYRPAYDRLLTVLEVTNKTYEYTNTLIDMLVAFGEKPDLVNLLCKTYYKNGYLDDARSVCQKAIQRSPKTADNHIYYGLSLEASKKPKRALAIIKQTAKQYPDSEFAQFTAAEMHQKNNSSLSAYKYYKQCTKADANSSRCWLGLANMAFEVKNFKESLDAYNKSCKLDRSIAIEHFRNSATKLKIANNLKWQDKFSSFSLKCRYQTN